MIYLLFYETFFMLMAFLILNMSRYNRTLRMNVAIFISELLKRKWYKMLILLAVFPLGMSANGSTPVLQDTIAGTKNNSIKKSIFSGELKEHSSFYKKMWGEHYLPLYYKPVNVSTITLNSVYGGLHEIEQVPEFYGLLLENNDKQFYLLKPLGGVNSFSESKFFRSIYNTKEFEDTYLGDFIREAYTIQHPYAFIASDYLAKSSGLYSGNPQIYHVSPSDTDTITDGTKIGDKLVSIYQLPNIDSQKVITNAEELIKKMHDDNSYSIDRELYVRARLFDMLIGDWNKIPENWNWISHADGDSLFYEPVVLDRSYAFTKVDGWAFRRLLNMLGLGFITDYRAEIKNVKNINKLGYELDVALTSGCGESVWVRQAQFLNEHLTDDVIEVAFRNLPEEMKDENIASIKGKLKNRKRYLEKAAKEYYRLLQKTPVITGSNKDERFEVNRLSPSDVQVQIYNTSNDSLIYNKRFSERYTKEIWIYGLGGQDKFEVKGDNGGIPILLVGGQGRNEYNIQNKKKLTVYEGKEQKQYLDSVSAIPDAGFIVPSDETALEYDYKKLRYTKFKVTPIGIYDSDLGLDLGTSMTYTIYGFRRAPFSRQHQLSYNYNSGFVYQGIFPDFNSKKSIHLSASVSTPNYFINFFGLGNETSRNRDKDKSYNRVYLSKYTLTPGLYYTIDKDQEFNISTSFEAYKPDNPAGRNRYINEVYSDDNSVFDTKYFANINATYVIDKKMDGFVSSFKFLINPGWVINLGEAKNNFTYLKSDLGVNLRFTDRITFATLLKGTTLFTNKYEFYQAATTELRGYRDNRFIGKHSFYQYTDVRLDMGRLDNPFTPLDYGVFLGFDNGRVWYPGEDSKKWHTSYGGGLWLTLFKNFTGKFSYFASKDDGRFMFQLGLVF